MDQTQRRLLGGVLALLLLLVIPLVGVLATSVVVSPEAIETGQVALTAPCPRLAAGEPCATCGLTRSFTAMSRARLGDAWAYNRAGPALYLTTWLVLAGLLATARRLFRELAASSTES